MNKIDRIIGGEVLGLNYIVRLRTSNTKMFSLCLELFLIRNNVFPLEIWLFCRSKSTLPQKYPLKMRLKWQKYRMSGSRLLAQYGQPDHRLSCLQIREITGSLVSRGQIPMDICIWQVIRRWICTGQVYLQCILFKCQTRNDNVVAHLESGTAKNGIGVLQILTDGSVNIIATEYGLNWIFADIFYSIN